MGYSYETIKNILSYAVALRPDGGFPLDARAYFGSYDAAAAAALTAVAPGSAEQSNSEYFYGQQLYVIENDVVSTYLIQVDKTLKEVGAVTLGDNKTITLDTDNGVLSLKSFGVEYYKYIPADVLIDGTYESVDTLPTEGVASGSYAKIGDVYYRYTDSWAAVEDGFVFNSTAKHELTVGWKTGLEPKVVTSADGNGFELAWYEPSSTTVEGLNSIVSGVQTSVDNLTKTVEANKNKAAVDLAHESTERIATDEALSTRITANKTAIDTLNGTADTEGSVLNTINTVLTSLVGDGTQDTIDSLTELVEWANNHDAVEIAAIENDIKANADDITALEDLLGTLPEGITSTTVVAYIAEKVDAEKTRAEAAELALSNRLNSAEATIGNLGTAANKSVEDFATAEQGAKADTAVQSVVASDNGYVAVDGNKVKAYELPIASSSVLGGVKADGSTIVVDASTGAASVSAIPTNKVTGLDSMISDAKTEATTEANTYTDENAILKTAISTSISGDIEAASDEKVISEKALLEALTWKTTI